MSVKRKQHDDSPYSSSSTEDEYEAPVAILVDKNSKARDDLEGTPYPSDEECNRCQQRGVPCYPQEPTKNNKAQVCRACAKGHRKCVWPGKPPPKRPRKNAHPKTPAMVDSSSSEFDYVAESRNDKDMAPRRSTRTEKRELLAALGELQADIRGLRRDVGAVLNNQRAMLRVTEEIVDALRLSQAGASVANVQQPSPSTPDGSKTHTTGRKMLRHEKQRYEALRRISTSATSSPVPVPNLHWLSLPPSPPPPRRMSSDSELDQLQDDDYDDEGGNLIEGYTEQEWAEMFLRQQEEREAAGCI
uniref:Zn(2)-C6 fungal-type domain-containing protein n=1 Tax=Mycena chlorophos TaxID=658473 RepID=A0ABQ0L439_MYCCL|nr:predicted protein [Mycena chlorophos]